MTTKRQAKYHGEIGANGKAYQKGQFIAEQKDYQASATKSKKGDKKQEIAPYVWEIEPDEEARSIYRYIAGTYYNIKTKEINYKFIDFKKENIEKIQSLVLRYENGEKWFYPNQEVYI